MDFGSLTYSNLEEKPELISQTLELIERSFEYIKPHSFAIDFYPLFNKKNFKNCHILISKKNELIAHIGNKKRTLLNNGKELPCSLWGGIAVNEKFRGQGVFKKFFNHLHSLEEDKTLQILWSGTPELYYDFGFELKYQQFEYQQKSGPSEFKLKNKSSLTKKELDQIISLYNEKIQKQTMFIRTPLDWKEWSKVESSDLYILSSPNQIREYFLINKGQDLENTIHEHSISKKSFNQVLTHGNLWAAAYEFPYPPDQISYLALFKNDYNLKNLWINGIDSI